MRLVGRRHPPRNRDGGLVQDDTDHQHGVLLTQGGGVQSQPETVGSDKGKPGLEQGAEAGRSVPAVSAQAFEPLAPRVGGDVGEEGEPSTAGGLGAGVAGEQSEDEGG